MVVGRGAPPREFFSIGEVSDRTGVKPHVLRYWETQFAELAPVKNRAGNRLYRESDIELISLIQTLVHEERYTVEGARRRLEELRGHGDQPAPDVLAATVLRSLRRELEEIRDLLHTDTP
jgi:DNA-binding transcriptional MerR regulator